MSSITSFIHVTVSTGHVCTSMEVPEESIATAAALIAAALRTDSPVPLAPLSTEFVLTAVQRGHSLRATILVPEYGQHIPVVTMAVGLDHIVGRDFWAQLHRGGVLPPATAGSEVPKQPWLAVRLELGILIAGPDAIKLGRLEVALAHGFLRHLSQSTANRAAA